MSGPCSVPVPPSEAVRQAAEVLTAWWQGRLEKTTDGMLDCAIATHLALLDRLSLCLDKIETSVDARAKAQG